MVVVTLDVRVVRRCTNCHAPTSPADLIGLKDGRELCFNCCEKWIAESEPR